MRRAAVLAAGLLVGLAATPAAAHITLDTDKRDPGAHDVTAALLVQSEAADGSFDGATGPGTTRVALHLPGGVQGVTASPAAGWRVRVSGTDVTWTGGLLPAGQSRIFELHLTSLPDVTVLTATAEQGYADGRSVTYDGPAGSARPAPTLALDGSSGQGGITSVVQAGQARATTRRGGVPTWWPWLLLPVAAGGAALVSSRRRRGSAPAP